MWGRAEVGRQLDAAGVCFVGFDQDRIGPRGAQLHRPKRRFVTRAKRIFSRDPRSFGVVNRHKPRGDTHFRHHHRHFLFGGPRESDLGPLAGHAQGDRFGFTTTCRCDRPGDGRSIIRGELQRARGRAYRGDDQLICPGRRERHGVHEFIAVKQTIGYYFSFRVIPFHIVIARERVFAGFE